MICVANFYRRSRPLIVAALLLSPSLQFAAIGEEVSEPRLSPTESLSRLATHDELVVELVAAEPLIADPVAIDFGSDGRLWVADMPDYTRPLSAEPDQGGSVRVLTDRDGDGRFEEGAIFQDGLRFPFDVKVWRDGVIVCDAPDVIYLEDTDGDQKADVRKVLLTGFGDHNAQARVNSLRWGVDGWLYGSCGLFGGTIKSFNGQTLELGDRDFRFHPDTGVIEPVSGRTQQSRVCDAAGNWFGCNSGTMIAHYPLSEHYLARNPYLAPPVAQTYIYSDSEELFPAGNPTILKLSGPPGRPTSACGLEIYRDDLLGKEYAGNSFTAEPVNHLVHRRVLASDGVTFAGRRAADESDREFLTSTDPWFRPVQIRTGLDGCLWIVDMHREVIEHPTWISAEALETLDPSAGNAEARIFRVRPKATQPRPIVDLAKLATNELVAALDSPNGPQRDLVQQLIAQRQLTDAAPRLVKLLTQSSRAETRGAAMNSLAGLNALNETLLQAALHDSSGVVRAHAIRLSEPFFGKSSPIEQSVLALRDDADPVVTLQLAYSLGESKDSRATDVLAELAWEHQDTPYLLAAVWSSLTPRNIQGVFDRLATKANIESPPSSIIDAISMYFAKLGKPAMLPNAIRALAGDDMEKFISWRASAITSLLDSLPPAERGKLIANSSVEPIIAKLTSAARAALEEPGAEPEQAIAAVRFLSAIGAEDEDTIDLVASLLEPRHAPALQLAAVTFLSSRSDLESSKALLNQWSSFSPTLRSNVLDIVLARKELIQLLFDSLQSDVLKAADIDAQHRLQLLRHEDEAIRNLSEAAFGTTVDSDRRKVVESFQSATALEGNAQNGASIFLKHCSSCHKLGDVGSSVGPDLAAITNRTPSSLIESIFDPNKNVEEKYLAYTAMGDDGLAHTGILISESATSITLAEQQGKQSTLLRESLEGLQATGLSLMPEGLEKDLTAQDVADLMAHLRIHAQRPKEIAGNSPEVVVANTDGSILLLASTAEIYGSRILYGTEIRSICDWYDQADYVAWNVLTNANEEFTLYLDFASEERTAGNRIVIDGFDKPVSFSTSSTGGADAFAARKIGTVRLKAGRNRIVVTADGPISAIPLINLRGIYLVRPGASLQDALQGTRPVEEKPDASTEISALLSKVEVGTPSEQEQIPRIWEHALAAGKRNNDAELTRLLELSLPKNNEPLRDWQTVVIGGGIINGMSSVNVWPRSRIQELVASDEALAARWAKALEQAVAIADNENVHLGIRYDALRISGADRFDRIISHVKKYLQPGMADDLQMGAVSAVADMNNEEAGQILLSGFLDFTPTNRNLALAGLLRTDQRAKAFLDSVESSLDLKNALTPEQIAILTASSAPDILERATAIFDAGEAEQSSAKQ